MINWLAQQGRTDEVSRAVQSLSRFYKLTLSRKQSISTIYREAETRFHLPADTEYALS